MFQFLKEYCNRLGGFFEGNITRDFEIMSAPTPSVTCKCKSANCSEIENHPKSNHVPGATNVGAAMETTPFRNHSALSMMPQHINLHPTFGNFLKVLF
jgi:hypothetical protein